MEGHSDEASAGLEDMFASGQGPSQLAQLIVHKHTKRLKSAGGGVDFRALAPTNGFLDQRSHGARRCDRCFGALANNRACETARLRLLAQARQGVSQRFFGKIRHRVGGGRPLAAHAHIEWAIEAERKAALGFVDLER